MYLCTFLFWMHVLILHAIASDLPEMASTVVWLENGFDHKLAMHTSDHICSTSVITTEWYDTYVVILINSSRNYINHNSSLIICMCSVYAIIGRGKNSFVGNVASYAWVHKCISLWACILCDITAGLKFQPSDSRNV